MNITSVKQAAERYSELIQKPYNQIYKAAGFEGLQTVTDCFGGQNVYVPSLRTILANCIEQEIIRLNQEYKCLSINSLAGRFGYSYRTLNRLVKYDGKFNDKFNDKFNEKTGKAVGMFEPN